MRLHVIDDLAPEDMAMLQALYSRSSESVDVHLEKVKRTGSSKFMQQYYVGYSHKSIADCGTTTVFVEDVSLLAAKAIQDNPLYSGQETSTRYIDMSKQRIEDPVGTSRSRRILDRWMDFYTSNQERVSEIIKRRYPQRSDEKSETYNRAVKARAFDILRGFLPAGITTQLSWHTNLRQAGDHLARLSFHPLDEIKRIAGGIRTLLHERYPDSGFDRSQAALSGISVADGIVASRIEWEHAVAAGFTYSTAFWSGGLIQAPDPKVFDHYAKILRTRPRGCVLPHFLSQCGLFTFEFTLDFGAFRDIQRHRNGACPMPLLDMSYGFETWYLEQLEEPLESEGAGGLHHEAVELIYELRSHIQEISRDPAVQQYYIPIGYRVPCRVTYGLPALIYVLELRSGRMIHPTLRREIHTMARRFRRTYPNIALHADMNPDDWDIRRGDQTITAKASQP